MIANLNTFSATNRFDRADWICHHRSSDWRQVVRRAGDTAKRHAVRHRKVEHTCEPHPQGPDFARGYAVRRDYSWQNGEIVWGEEIRIPLTAPKVPSIGERLAALEA